MAKSLLTTQAIKFLVDAYDDETSNRTFAEIRQMVIDEFEITVSIEAIRKTYHKHKSGLSNVNNYHDKKALKSECYKQNMNENEPKNKADIKKKVIKSNLTKTNDFDTSISDSLTGNDIDNLLKSN